MAANACALAVRSDLSIDAQVQAGGATWLDRQLVAREPSSLSSGGFKREIRDAMDARVEHLVAEGLAKRQGQRVLFARDMLDTLRRRELEATAARIDASTGLPYHPAREGEPVVGIYRRRFDLASGRFALIDDELGFSLVPWSPSLERHLGRQVSEMVQSNRIEWSLGRARWSDHWVIPPRYAAMSAARPPTSWSTLVATVMAPHEAETDG